MEKKVRLKDVASRLGISTVTVSNALAGRKGVSKAMRDKVTQTAKEMGFDMTHYEAKSVRHVKIGAVMQDHAGSEEMVFYSDLFQKAQQTISTHNGLIQMETVPGDERDDPLPDLVKKGNIDGLLVIGHLQESYLDRIMETASFPVILVNFYRPDLPCTSVLPNNYLGMYRATQYGIDMGHRKLGFIGVGETSGNMRDRFFGFVRCLKLNGIPLNREWIFDGKELGDKLFVHMPEAMPDLFVCAGDATAVLVYETLEQKGISVPDDVSIVSYGNYLSGHPFGLRLTTYNVDRERMAQRAVELLLREIDGGEPRRDPVYIDSVMIERSSVKDLR